MKIMRRGEQQRLSLEAGEVPRPIVDQIVRIDDSLVAAEDDVRGRNEREVAAQPAVLCVEGTGNVHRGRRDEHFVMLGQFPHHILAIRHRRQVFEEGSIEHRFRGCSMRGRDRVLEMTSPYVGRAEVHAISRVVPP